MSIGYAWAVMDHFENETGKPTPASTLKKVLGTTRAQLRKWEREGRVDVYYVTDENGTREKAYMRPKERIKNGKMDEKVH